MLFLHFRIGGESFALSTEAIVEVVPLTNLRPVRHAPDGIAGSFEYRGRFVLVVDLCRLELGRSAHERMSTRILVMRHPQDPDGLFGLIVENATETLRLDPAEFAPFAAGPDGLVQRIAVDGLVPSDLLGFLARGPVNP